ncbi:MAG TPA: S1 family peptidase [Candidatus Microbacterium pullistercoris]|nr:S1 family peptidase [Candidatus Microbacterium pullistercoris]
MSSTFKRGARLSAIGAAAALAAGGLMVAPAAAEEAAPAANLDQIAAQAFGIPGVVGVTTDNQSIFIKVLGESGEGGIAPMSASNEQSVNDLASQFGNVQVVEGQAFTPVATNDVVGGAGYMTTDDGMTSAGACSVGFSAWSPNGDPAIITAGHCNGTDDGMPNLFTSQPSQEPAVGGEGYTIMAELGTWGYTQFGGPGNTSVENPYDVQPEELENGTDIAVIDDINPELNLLPSVTDWTTAGEDDLAKSATSVTAVGSASIGDEIRRSGRTTGSKVGVVNEEGYTLVGDPQIGYHPVYGFNAEAAGDYDLAVPGDSGGSVVIGNTAVGITSGAGENPETGNTDLWFADLPDAMEQLHANGGEYQVALDIAEPEVTKASAEQGTTFEGTAPANSEVTIGGDIEATATADENGNFSFPAPNDTGSFDITLQAKQGYNVSETVNATVKTTKIQLDAPAITSPENESKSTEAVTAITGTGQPGAEVTLQGDVEGTATVGDDGNWSVDVELGFGAYTVGATQSLADSTSDARWVSFQVVPGAPSIVTPEDGGSYEEGMIPAITGESPINGATVSLDIEGPEAAQATIEAVRDAGGAEVVGGVWSVELQEQLAPGTYTIAATQSVDGVTSDATSVTFEVVAAGSGGGDEGDQGDQGGEGDEGDDNDLAPTGADSATTVLPLAGGAAVILLAGATLLVVRRVTRA